MSYPRTRSEMERLIEEAFKRGHDQGRADQKKAAPPPKAKQYRDERNALYDVLERAETTVSLDYSPQREKALTQRGFEMRDALAKVKR